MPDFVAIYSLKNIKKADHGKLINIAVELGWSNFVKSSKNISYKLPENTLFGSFKDHKSATSSFEKISSHSKLKGVDIKINKYFIGCLSEKTYGSDEKA